MNKKLKLNKRTISNLSGDEMNAIKAAGTVYKGCWENLWTWYECEVVYSGPPTKDTGTMEAC